MLEAFQTWPSCLSEDVKSLRRGQRVIGFVILMETTVWQESWCFLGSVVFTFDELKPGVVQFPVVP